MADEATGQEASAEDSTNVSGNETASLINSEDAGKIEHANSEEGKKEDQLSSAYGENPNSKSEESDEVKTESEESKEKVDESKEEDSKSDETKSESETTKYEFKLPEGVELDEQAEKEITELFSGLKLDNEGAQKVMNHYLKTVNEFSKEMQDRAQQQAEQWRDETKADKELGGDNLDQTIVLANKGLKAISPDGAFEKLLNETGLGNNKWVIKTLKTLGEAVSEDTPTSFNKSTTSGSSKEDMLAAAYGPNPKKN